MEQYRAVVKQYGAGEKKHQAIAEATGVDPNVCWEIGAAAEFRKNGPEQREQYRARVSKYLSRAGEADVKPWATKRRAKRM